MDMGDGFWHLYDGDGLGTERYRREHRYNLVDLNGEAVWVMPDGDLLSIPNEYKEEYILTIKDRNTQQASNNYFHLYISERESYIIDVNWNKIKTTADFDRSDIWLYEEDGILIYCNEKVFYAYDLNNKKVILELDSEIEYIEGYKAFYCNSKIYSLNGEEIYSFDW